MDPSDRDALYALPLADFVRARNDLAKALRLAGEKDAAKAIKALEKPSLVAWAINQLVRRYRADLDTLFVALDNVRAAQLGDANDKYRPTLIDAMSGERATMRRLETDLESILTDGGHATTRHTIDRALRSVRAKSLINDDRAMLLRAQMAKEETDDDGFMGLAAQLAGAAVPPAPAAAARNAPTPPPPPRIEKTSGAVAAPRPVKADAPLPPPIDLDKERKRRKALEDEAQARVRQESIDALKVEIDASRLVEQKQAKDVETAARNLADAERRLTAARDAHQKAQAKLQATVDVRNDLRRDLSNLEDEESGS